MLKFCEISISEFLKHRATWIIGQLSTEIATVVMNDFDPPMDDPYIIALTTTWTCSDAYWFLL